MGLVAMGLKGQEHQPHRSAMPFERDIKSLRRNRKGSLIIVRLSVNQQNRRLDLVGITEGRHLGVHVGRLPLSPLFRLKPEGCECAIVSTAACNARAKEITVR